ncbi:MAG: TetR/AcrR family transcriptional regulator [Spirochaetales bacterium]|nr:TetR/AcrR family transcriptional regulator [Spirochaetales bacterium]
MTRISKNPEERKDEIISTARQLFIKKGFNETKVSDIVKQIGVSQGVFYYYFSSKDEIIDAIVDNYINRLVSKASAIVEQDNLKPLEKLEKMADIQLVINHQENNNIHAIKGVDIHEKILTRLVLDYVPLMAKAFCPEPNNKLLYQFEIFVTAGNVLFDPGIFSWKEEEINQRITTLLSIMEKSLNLQEGSLSFYKRLMGYR